MKKKRGGAKDGNAYFFEETIEVALDSWNCKREANQIPVRSQWPWSNLLHAANAADAVEEQGTLLLGCRQSREAPGAVEDSFGAPETMKARSK